MMAKPPTRKQAKAAAIKLHAAIVRAANTHCQAAGILRGECGGVRQCAHIIPKKANTAVSVAIDNGWVLCQGHHRAVDANPGYWLQLVDNTIGTDEVLMMQAESDHAHTYGLHIHNLETGSPEPVSPLLWWRHKVAELHWLAPQHGINPATVLPVHINRWIEANRCPS